MHIISVPVKIPPGDADRAGASKVPWATAATTPVKPEEVER